MRRFLSSSRFLVAVAVVGCFAGAGALLFGGSKETLALLVATFSGALGGKKLLLASIEAVDTFLLATVLGVLFLGKVVSWDGERNLGPYGAPIAAVILAITLDARKKACVSRAPRCRRGRFRKSGCVQS